MIEKTKKFIKKNFTKNYWQSSMSSKWHNKRQKEAYGDFDIFAQAVCNKIEHLKFDTVIEVGTGAGTLITLISKKLTSYNKFVGIDINKQQIEKNTRVYKDLKNVEFIYEYIEKYIKDNNLNNVVIVAQNTFDYFKKDELNKLFSLIYSNIKNVAIAISTAKKNKNLNDSIDRVEADFKVYHHNYCALLISVGYELMSIDPYGVNEETVIVVGQKRG